MNSTLKNVILICVAIILGSWALRIVFDLAIGLIGHILLPIAIVGGVLYVGYMAFGRKALGGGRRYLP